ncbi:MAG: PilZ domain-containing protein [Candidatus Omnitrophota bacterium]
MQETKQEERRHQSRFCIDIPLNYCSCNSGVPIKALTHDISIKGLCIISDKLFPDGTVLNLCLMMRDNNEKIFIKGKVIWLKDTSYQKYRMGIRLEDMSLKPVPMVLRTILSGKKYY